MGFFRQGASEGGDGNRAMTSALAKIYELTVFVYISSVLFLTSVIEDLFLPPIYIIYIALRNSSQI